jgi:cellulose synthase/poly-beta-1,6-N-acetylglucosamine synthase-like glycosyltransferase
MRLPAMNTRDELAIVIPARNEEIFLPRLLASLATQDYCLIGSTDVFIADAGSTDRTVAVALSFNPAGFTAPTESSVEESALRPEK